MAKHAKKLILALTVALGTTQPAKPAKPEGTSGMELQRWCFAKENSLDSFSCTMFLLGFINGLDTADGANDARVWCLPKDITAGQTELIVKKFMREHPEDLHMPAAAIVGRALYLPYACKKEAH